MNYPGPLKLLCFVLMILPVVCPAQYRETPLLRSSAESFVKAEIKQGQEMVQRGHYDSAIILFKSLQPMCSGLDGETRLRALLNNHIGATYIFKGSFDLAVQHLSLAAAAVVDSPKVYSMMLIKVYNNLSLALSRIADNENALLYLDKAEEMATQYRHVQMLPTLHINKGRIYKEMELWAKSRAEFDEALRLMDTIRIETATAGITQSEMRQACYTNLGQLYFTKGDLPGALSYLQTADKLLTPQSNPYYRVPNMIALGRTYTGLGNYKLAEQYLTGAMALSLQNGITDGISETAHYLSDLYAAQGRFEPAYRFQLKFKQMEDSIRQSEKTKQVRQLETRYRLVEKDKKLAEGKLLRAEQERALKSRNLWILLISVVAFLVMIILVVVFRNYAQKQRLQQQRLSTLEKDKQLSLMKAMLEGEEKERGRIAGNLHDGIGSMISAVKMNFSILKLTHIENKEVYHKGMLLLDEAAKELRATAHNLMPEILVQEGLEAAIAGFCKRMAQTRLLEIECEMNGDFTLIEKDMGLLVYRIVQELVNNIVKHARATHALVQLNYNASLLMITVEDNGRGLQEPASTTGMGLRSIREKVSMLNGQMSMDSSSTDGTQVYIEIDC